MLKWRDQLYISDLVRDNAEQAAERLNARQPVFGMHLITLPTNKNDQLDILPSLSLMQKAVYDRTPEIVGIAGNHEDAVALVMIIMEETLKETGRPDIKAYLTSKP